jgi:catechol 2,3-dioxygenase-like lactoylglutathione lyase family enzyme
VKSTFGHILFGVKPENLAFYKELLTFMGWDVLYDDPAMLGIGIEGGGSLWFGCEVKEITNDYDGPGMNHLGINVESLANVDSVAAYLKEHGVEHLFETPRHRPEFSGEGETYYQVMFTSPDNILFEVLYSGPVPA